MGKTVIAGVVLGTVAYALLVAVLISVIVRKIGVDVPQKLEDNGKLVSLTVKPELKTADMVLLLFSLLSFVGCMIAYAVHFNNHTLKSRYR